MTRSRQPGNHERSEHLTMEQLSAFLDKQLPPAEQAVVDAHLHSCEQCRLALADLRATVALVRAMPQPALPRAFTLPVNVTPLPIQAAREERPLHRPARGQPPARSGLRRTMRFVSAIAAVLGLLFILSGLLPFLSVGNTAGGASTTASVPQRPAVQGVQHTPFAASQATTPNTAGTHLPQPTRTGQNDNQAAGRSPSTGTPVPRQTPATPATSPLQNIGSPVLPAFLDLGTIEGRLSLGLLLALLGAIGLLFTRRRYQRTR